MKLRDGFNLKKTFDNLRKQSHSNDEWVINIQDEYKLVIVALWRTLLKQNKTKEALLVAEEGGTQALVDLLKLPSESYCAEIDHLDRLLHVVDVTKQP